MVARSFLRDSVSVHAGLTGERYLQDWQEFGKKKTVELNVQCTLYLHNTEAYFMLHAADSSEMLVFVCQMLLFGVEHGVSG